MAGNVVDMESRARCGGISQHFLQTGNPTGRFLQSRIPHVHVDKRPKARGNPEDLEYLSS